MAGVEPRFLDAGETALVVEFGSTINDETNARVLALDAALTAASPADIIELVPTYRSLMIHYDPLVLSRAALIAKIRPLLASKGGGTAQRRLWRIPACYDAGFAIDIDHVAKTTGLSPGEVFSAHANARYKVFMYGFSPGWAYLGGLPASLALPRRSSPREKIPAGSLIIAGGQAIIATVSMPSGWHILGRTPERLFAPERENAFLVAVGDIITFESIGRAEFDALERRAAQGEVLSTARLLP